MRPCRLTLRTALSLSIAVHAALFGTALAFARFGVPGQLSGPEAVTVLLVGPESGKGSAGAVEALKIMDAAMAAPVMPDAAPEQMTMPGTEEETGEQPVLASLPAGGAQQGRQERESVPSGSQGHSAEAWRLLREALDRAKDYPRFAREMGIEGTVLVRFRVEREGGIGRVEVVRSSGARILDDASVSTVRRAAPMPFVQGWVEVPLVYQLKQQEK